MKQFFLIIIIFLTRWSVNAQEGVGIPSGGDSGINTAIITTASALPATAVEGSVYFVSQTGARYRRNASGWDVISLPNGNEVTSPLAATNTVTPSLSYAKYDVTLTGVGTVNNPSSYLTDGSKVRFEFTNTSGSSQTISFGTEYLDNSNLISSITIEDQSVIIVDFIVATITSGQRMMKFNVTGAELDFWTPDGTNVGALTGGNTTDNDVILRQNSNPFLRKNSDGTLDVIADDGTTEAINVTADGKVGIGTNGTAFGVDLTVGSQADITGKTFFRGTGVIDDNGASQTTYANGANTGAIFLSDAGEFQFRSGNEPSLVLDTDGDVVLRSKNETAGNAGGLFFQELAVNGTDKIGFKAPDTLAADILYTLPSADAAGSLTSDGSGNLSWAAATNTGTIMTESATMAANQTQDLAGFTQTWNSTAVSPLMQWDGANGKVSIGTSTVNGVLSIQNGAADTPVLSFYDNGGALLYNNYVGATSMVFGSNRTTDPPGNNTGFGHEVLDAATGTSNTAFGASVLKANTSGSSNTAMGLVSMTANTTGNQNSAYGQNSLRSNISGGSNAAFGYDAMRLNTTGQQNTAFGHSALRGNVSGSFNTAIGRQSLYNNIGSSNVGIGYNSLFTNTTGASNLAIGTSAMFYNTTGGLNVALGNFSMNRNTEGLRNASIGASSLQLNTTGDFNTSVGAYSGTAIGSTDRNTAIGYKSLTVADSSLTYTVSSINTATETVTMSTAHGLTAGAELSFRFTSTGSNPVGFSEELVGSFVASGTNDFVCNCNITSAGTGTITAIAQIKPTNATAIGHNATVDQSNQVSLGDDNVAQLKSNNLRIDVSTTSSSGNILVHDGTQYVPSSARFGRSRNVAPNGATTTITDDGNLIIWYEVAQITGAGTVINLPDPAASLGEVIIRVKFTGIDAGQSASITTVSGTANIEDAGTFGTSLTVGDTEDNVEFTFKLSTDNTTWRQGS